VLDRGIRVDSDAAVVTGGHGDGERNQLAHFRPEKVLFLRRTSLQFEVKINSRDQFDRFRERGSESDKETANWIHGFREILICPPVVEILRIRDS
jgi:hypothetical protein